MKQNSFSIFIFLLLLCVPSYLHAQISFENEIIDSGEKSIFPRLAIDPISGTTAILWTNYNSSNPLIQRVYIKFITKKKGDLWKINKRQIVSGIGEHGSVAFNSTDNNFYVVWDTRKGGHLTESREFIFASNRGAKPVGNIQGRMYNTKGKKTSAIITYDNQGSLSQNPLCVYNKNNNNFLLSWQWKGGSSIFNPAPTGFFIAVIDSNGEQEGEAKKVRDAIRNSEGMLNVYPTGGFYNPTSNRIFLFTAEDVPAGAGVAGLRHVLYTFDSRGNVFSKIGLTGLPVKQATWYTSISPANQQKQAFHFALWSENGRPTLRQISNKGKPQGQSTKVNKSKNSHTTAIAYSSENDLYLLVYDGSTGLTSRFMDASGKVDKKRKILTKGNNSGRPVAIWNPVMNQFIVVWIERNTSPDKVILTTIGIPEGN